MSWISAEISFEVHNRGNVCIKRYTKNQEEQVHSHYSHTFCMRSASNFINSIRYDKVQS